MFCTSCDGKNVGLPIWLMSLNVNCGKTAVSGHVRDPGETAGEVQQLFTRFIRIDLLALRIDSVIAEPEFVSQVAAKQVRPAGGKATIGVVFHAAEKPAAIASGRVEGPGNQTRLVFIAETEEGVVLLGIFLVDANVKIVTGLAAHWIREKVKSVSVDIGGGIKFGNRQRERINLDLRDDIRRVATGVIRSKGNPAQPAGVESAVLGLDAR